MHCQCHFEPHQSGTNAQDSRLPGRCLSSLDYQGQSGEIYRRVDGQITREPVAIEKEEPLRQQLASFVDCALTGGEPRVSGSHAAAALRARRRNNPANRGELKMSDATIYSSPENGAVIITAPPC